MPVAAFVLIFTCSGLWAQTAAPAPQRGRGNARPQPEPRIVTFEAHPASIKPGETAQLIWATENPSGLTIDPDVGPVTPRGSKQLKPVATTTYTLSMRGPNNTTITGTATITVAGTTPVSAGATNSTAAKKGFARTPDGKPDFSGVYAFGGGGGGGRGARGAGSGPVLKPGAEKYKVDRGAQDVGKYADCMPLSPPDAFGVPYQFQIVQNHDTLVFMHEYPGTFRIIPLDGEPHQPDPDPAWMGDSVGRWEGDTLIIDTIGYNDKTEVSGYHHSDALHTVERLTPIEGGIQYAVTIEDPNVFVAPWTETRTYRFNVPSMKRIMEFVCENNRDYRPLFGAEKKD